MSQNDILVIDRKNEHQFFVVVNISVHTETNLFKYTCLYTIFFMSLCISYIIIRHKMTYLSLAEKFHFHSNFNRIGKKLNFTSISLNFSNIKTNFVTK